MLGESNPMKNEKSREKSSATHKGKLKGKSRYNWKGDSVGYINLHSWVRREMGKANSCVYGHLAKRYVWANKSGEYKRDLNDWHSLCDSCNLTDGIKINPRFLKREGVII